MNINLPVRYLAMHSSGPEDNIEQNITQIETDIELETEETALILVDVWGGHPVKSHMERTRRIMAEKIAPVLIAAREAAVAVVYAPSPSVAKKYPQFAPYSEDESLENIPATEEDLSRWPPKAFRDRTGQYSGYQRQPHVKPKDFNGPYPDWWHIKDIADVISPRGGDLVVATGDQLQRLLADRKILHLLYVGFATNICVLMRDYGIRAMKDRGYLTVVLRDCTTAIETKDSWDGMWTTRWAIQEIERYHFTALSGDFVNACTSNG